MREWSMESQRSQISTIEQDPFLFSKTLKENIAFGRSDADMTDIKEAARAAQAHDFVTQFQDGYNTEVGERGETLHIVAVDGSMLRVAKTRPA